VAIFAVDKRAAFNRKRCGLVLPVRQSFFHQDASVLCVRRPA
jgi:hypothetical protein